MAPYLGRGQTVAFVGSSGVGKSTLIAGLTGSEIATRGIREDEKLAVLEGGGTRIRSYQPIARGAIGLAPFRWRTPLFGAESGVD